MSVKIRLAQRGKKKTRGKGEKKAKKARQALERGRKASKKRSQEAEQGANEI